MAITDADKDETDLSKEGSQIDGYPMETINENARIGMKTEAVATNGHVKLNVTSPDSCKYELEKANGQSDHILTVSNNEDGEAELEPMLEQTVQDHKDEKGDIIDEIVDQTVESGPVPIDRGWAWMVLVGATLEMTIVIGILKTSGIFFVNFQDKFNSTSSMTSLISTVQNGVYSVGALLVMTVGVKFLSGRKFNMFGGTLLCISYIISSRAEDIRMLLFSHGVLQGLGIACMQPIALVMVGSYFEKRRGFANSIAVSGGSLGGLILAPLLTTLFENYGYSGAMLVTSALFLHGWVTGALFRPQTFYTKRQKVINTSNDDVKNNDVKRETHKGTMSTNLNGNLTNGDIPKIHIIRRQYSFEVPESPTSPFSIVSMEELWINDNRMRAETFSEGDNTKRIRHDSAARHRLRSQADKPHSGSSLSLIIDKIAESKVARYASSEYSAGSIVDIPYATGQRSRVASASGNQTKERASICKAIAKTFDFSLFKNPVFVVFTFSAGLLCASMALVTVYIAPHAKENGIDASGVATLLTIYSAIDFCSRIIVGVISDKGWLRRSTIIGISAAIIGLTAHLVRFYTSYEWFVIYAVILGLFSGVYFSLFAVVIVDYLTLAKLQSCLGFTTLFHGAGVSCSFAIIGVLRDSTGSYLIPFHLLGTMAFIGGMLMASLSYIEKISKKKNTSSNKY